MTLVRFLPSEGEPYWIEHRWFVDRSTNRSVIVLDGVGRDVTLQKRQEEAIQESLRTAEENLRAKSLFLANMSHEIRTPLNAIIGQVELLRDTSLSSEQREMLDSISSAGSILLSHLTDVLDFSRLEAQRVKLHKGAFDLVKALREALDIVKDTARERNLALESSFDRAVPVQVIGDKSRLLQIVLNLLSNAIKFTDHGEVRLTLSVLEECESSVRVEVAVSDTGIGFPVETWNEMLQPFSQRDPSYSRKREGAGLGLAIVSRLVDLMDADLRVESEPGVGSTFFLRLDFPIPTGTSRYCDKSEENPDAADSEENESALTLGVGGRVLIVEDNEVNRKVLVRQLQKIGFSETDCAHNGEEAIRIFQPEFHQLVLMDIQMPMLDGVEALNALRKAHPTHNVPIVAVTAHALPGDRENYLELGFQGYISKPVRLPELRSTLRIALARYRT